MIFWSFGILRVPHLLSLPESNINYQTHITIPQSSSTGYCKITDHGNFRPLNFVFLINFPKKKHTLMQITKGYAMITIIHTRYSLLQSEQCCRSSLALSIVVFSEHRDCIPIEHRGRSASIFGNIFEILSTIFMSSVHIL